MYPLLLISRFEDRERRLDYTKFSIRSRSADYSFRLSQKSVILHKTLVYTDSIGLSEPLTHPQLPITYLNNRERRLPYTKFPSTPRVCTVNSERESPISTFIQPRNGVGLLGISSAEGCNRPCGSLFSS